MARDGFPRLPEIREFSEDLALTAALIWMLFTADQSELDHGWHPSLDGIDDKRVKRLLLEAKSEGLIDFEMVEAFRGRWTTSNPRLLKGGYEIAKALRETDQAAPQAPETKRQIGFSTG